MILRNTKTTKENEISTKIVMEKSNLEVFLENLSPALACEIKECWIDSDAFTIENLVGNGNFTLFHVLEESILSV